MRLAGELVISVRDAETYFDKNSVLRVRMRFGLRKCNADKRLC